MPGDPFGVALGSDGAYWFAMSAANNVQRLTADGKATPLSGFPEPGLAEFFPRQIAAGPNNTLWVTMEIPGEDATRSPASAASNRRSSRSSPNRRRRRRGSTKARRRRSRTRRKRASVKFRFSSTTAGATFECALVKKPAKKARKAPKPKFKSCKSPKKLKLRPGRYRFSVRAVGGGVADPTPATRSFRVIHVG